MAWDSGGRWVTIRGFVWMKLIIIDNLMLKRRAPTSPTDPLLVTYVFLRLSLAAPHWGLLALVFHLVILNSRYNYNISDILEQSIKL